MSFGDDEETSSASSPYRHEYKEGVHNLMIHGKEILVTTLTPSKGETGIYWTDNLEQFLHLTDEEFSGLLTVHGVSIHGTNLSLRMRTIENLNKVKKRKTGIISRINSKIKIGEGAFGTIYSINCDGATMAMKKVRDNYEPLWAASLRHINIVNISTMYKHDGYMLIFMEKCSQVKLSHRSSKGIRIQYILDILNGLEYLHGRDIVHRDIKMDNTLYNTTNSKFVICDFGVSCNSGHTKNPLTDPTLLSGFSGDTETKEFDYFCLAGLVTQTFKSDDPIHILSKTIRTVNGSYDMGILKMLLVGELLALLKVKYEPRYIKIE